MAGKRDGGTPQPRLMIELVGFLRNYTSPQRQPPVALGVSSPFELISAILSLN